MLTQEQKATNDDTWHHIHRVRELLHICVKDLIDRGHEHDQSKLESPEVELFTEHNANLANSTYGSKEFNDIKKGPLKPALDHHYARNAHHPEHWPEGINDMSLLDLLEMFCDWKGSSERHHDGNILKSIEINSGRFGIDSQLVRIFQNTAKYFEGQ